MLCVGVSLCTFIYIEMNVSMFVQRQSNGVFIYSWNLITKILIKKKEEKKGEQLAQKFFLSISK